MDGQFAFSGLAANVMLVILHVEIQAGMTVDEKKLVSLKWTYANMLIYVLIKATTNWNCKSRFTRRTELSKRVVFPGLDTQ